MSGKSGKVHQAGKKIQTSREEQVLDRRRSLLDAAVKVISKRGLTGVTISSIAAEAKCSYGMVAFHFQSKEGVIFAALDHTAAEYEAYIAHLASGDMGPAGRLRAMIDTDFSRKAAGASVVALWLAFWAEAVRVSSYRKRCGALRDHYNRTVSADITELALSRGVRVDADRVALMLNALISGLWVENMMTMMPAAQSMKRGHDASLAFMRLYFPDDF